MDELMDRYGKLTNARTFDPDTFPAEWDNLADDFDKDGRPAMAAGCRGRADWYRGVGRGYAQKLAYTEVTRVPAQPANKEERVLFCGVEDTWTKHVRLTDGWMCACGAYVPINTHKELS